MSSVKSLLFSHNHHLLSVKGCEAGLDVLAFEGDEALSQPFRYRIEFTSADHAISKEMMPVSYTHLTARPCRVDGREYRPATSDPCGRAVGPRALAAWKSGIVGLDDVVIPT